MVSFIRNRLKYCCDGIFVGWPAVLFGRRRVKQIAILLLIAVIVGWIVVRINPTGHDRVAAFIAGFKDPTQAWYHVQRSFEAIVNGGWFGVGIGDGQAKLTGLPVPPTDSIFAVIVEELGAVGESSDRFVCTVDLARIRNCTPRA